MYQVVENVKTYSSGAVETQLVVTAEDAAEALVMFRSAKLIRAGADVETALAEIERRAE